MILIFGHNKEFLYGPRGFNSIEAHDEEIIKKWNSIVSPEDEVYHLGDVMLGDNEKGIQYLKSLNGKIHIILGNHDTDNRIKLYETCPNIVSIEFATRIKSGEYVFFLSHYPTCVGIPEDQKKMWCLCGHMHTQDKYIDMKKKCYHVELECHNNYPIEIEEIKKDIDNYKSERRNNLD